MLLFHAVSEWQVKHAASEARVAQLEEENAALKKSNQQNELKFKASKGQIVRLAREHTLLSNNVERLKEDSSSMYLVKEETDAEFEGLETKYKEAQPQHKEASARFDIAIVRKIGRL